MNTQLLVGTMRSGKTYKLIKLCEMYDGIILCSTKQETIHIMKTAKDNGFKINEPITTHDLKIKLAGRDNPIFIDNVENVLSNLIIRPIHTITSGLPLKVLGHDNINKFLPQWYPRQPKEIRVTRNKPSGGSHENP